MRKNHSTFVLIVLDVYEEEGKIFATQFSLVNRIRNIKIVHLIFLFLQFCELYFNNSIKKTKTKLTDTWSRPGGEEDLSNLSSHIHCLASERELHNYDNLDNRIKYADMIFKLIFELEEVSEGELKWATDKEIG